MIEPIRKPTPKKREPRSLKSRPHVIPSSVKQAVFARDDYLCQWCRSIGGALDPHHRLRRSAGGKDAAYVLVSVHRLCHDEIHRNVAESKRRGFLVSSEDELARGWE